MSTVQRTISVVISSYNYERYIAGTIDSVLAQTRAPDEVIVVDDGSTDSSLAVIERYRNRVRIIAKPNGGQASALNAGFAASRGNIVVFVDSDDRLLPDCLRTVEASWSDDLAKLHFRLRLIDGDGRWTGETRPSEPLPAGDLVPAILAGGGYNTSPTTGNAFARAALEKIMPIPEADWRTYADCPILFLAPFFGRIGAINEAIGEYRVHADNASGLVRGGEVQLKALRGELVRDLRQDAVIREFCERNGFPFRRGTVLRNWYSIKMRLISVRLDRDTHPINGERLPSLLAAALARLWSSDQLALRNKVLFSGWSLAMALVPRRLARRLAPLAYTRANSGGFATLGTD